MRRPTDILILALFACTAGDPDDDSGDTPVGVPEDCANGADDDLDGRTDCDDSDCTTVCDETCDDGRDNDGDGLVDCEDAECVDVCVEDCTNGEDDDGDGLVDCDDDDCFGTDGCDVVLSRVTGGHLAVRVERRGWYAASSSASYAGRTEVAFTASSVTGTAVVRQSDSTVTCGWTVDRASGSQVQRWRLLVYPDQAEVSGETGLTRMGFATSGACGGLGSEILPGSLRAEPRGTTTYAIPFLLPRARPYLISADDPDARWYIGADSPSYVTQWPITTGTSGIALVRSWSTALEPGETIVVPY